MIRGMTLLERAYSDYAHGSTEPLYITSSHGTIEEDLSYYFATYRDFFTIEKRLLRYVRGSVIDCGAGTGRISLYLQKKAIQVTAVDNSSVMKDIGCARGVTNYIVADAFALPSSLSVDMTLLLGNTIGICRTKDDIVRLFSSCAKILTRNGKLLLTATEPESFGYTTSICIEGTLTYRGDNELFSWFLASRYDIEEAALSAGLRQEYIDACDGVAGFIFTHL